MAIEGPLRELGMHDVFQLLDLSRKTGVLRVRSPVRDNHGSVYFESGAVIFAEVHSNPHLLGELLLRKGKVAQIDLDTARQLQEQGDERRLGEILVSIEAIVQAEIARSVTQQVEEVVFEVLNWTEGHFSFVEGEGPETPPEAAVRIPTEALMMEGARRIDEWGRIQQHIPHTGVVPFFAAGTEGEPGSLVLRPAEWKILTMVDDERSVAAVAAELGQSDFDVAKVIFGLESSGVLGVREPAKANSDISTSDRDEILRRINETIDEGQLEGARGKVEAALARLPEDAHLWELLGRVHSQAGRYEEAEDSFRKALRLDSLMGVSHRSLGDVLVRQGRYSEALDWWERWLNVEAFVVAEEAEVRRVKMAIEAARNLDLLLKGENV